MSKDQLPQLTNFGLESKLAICTSPTWAFHFANADQLAVLDSSHGDTFFEISSHAKAQVCSPRGVNWEKKNVQAKNVC